jgi:hypothetical protein
LIRPKGLEFGACTLCHNGTRDMDAVAGFASRVYGLVAGAETQKQLRSAAKAFSTKYPHLMADLTNRGFHPSLQGQIIEVGPDSRLNYVLDAFAARMGLALFRETTGRPAPAHSHIYSEWRTNVSLDQDAALNVALAKHGHPRTLVQGVEHTMDQFRYWAATLEPNKFLCVAAFRLAFGITAFIDASEPPDKTEPTFRPGFLKGFKV